MKLSKILHVASVLSGLGGLAMSAFAVLLWPSGRVWFDLTREMMLLCTNSLLLAAIWLQLATLHHMQLEKTGELI